MNDLFALFQSMLDSMRYAPRLHAMLVHLPIAAVVFGGILGIALLFTRGNSAGVRWSCFAIFAIGAAAALGSSYSGEAALTHVPSDAWENSSIHVADRHELLGTWVWIPLALTASLVAFTAVPKVVVRWSALGGAALMALVCLGWVAATSHYGALLVHEHSLIRGPLPQPAVVEPPAQDPAEANAPRASKPPQTQPPEPEKRKPGFFGIPTQ